MSGSLVLKKHPIILKRPPGALAKGASPPEEDQLMIYPPEPRFIDVDSRRYHGVSSILAHTMPEEDRQRLASYQRSLLRKYNGDRALVEQKLMADRARGMAVHNAIHRYWRTRQFPLELPSQYRAYEHAIKGVLLAVTPEDLLGFEEPVYHETLGYAGKPDLWGRWGNLLTVGDFKTSCRSKEESDLESQILQTVAYLMALEEMHRATNLVFDQVLVVQAFAPAEGYTSPKPGVNLVCVSGSELDVYKEKWLARLEQFRQIRARP